MKPFKITHSHYSALSGIFLLGGGSLANAQVIYTDVDPDIELNINESFLFDPNDNGIPDFEIRQFYDDVYSSFCQVISAIMGSIHPLNYSASLNADNEDFSFARSPFVYQVFLNEMGEPIKHTDEWKGYFDTYETWNTFRWGLLGGVERTDSCGTTFFWGPVGEWPGADYKFAGYRIEEAGSHFYGWIRLSLSDNAQKVTIHDYALNTSPDVMIKAGATTDCYPPSVSGVSNITSSSARIKWAPVFEATKYQVYYRIAGIPAWTKLNITGDAQQKTIGGLACNTTYEWKIRSRCDAEFSDFSSIYSFTTASCRLFDNHSLPAEVNIFPNPAHDYFIVDMHEYIDQDVRIGIYNLLGETMYEENYIADEEIKIDVSALPKGNYILKINSETKRTVEKLIIQ